MFEYWFPFRPERYRWWSCAAWGSSPTGYYGIKVGPVSLQIWRYDGRGWWSICVLNRVVYDTWLTYTKRQREDEHVS